MREFLGRAIAKKGDELLRNIELLIKGKPINVEEVSIERYEKEFEDVKAFFLDKFKNQIGNYGYWEVFAYPARYREKRIADFNNNREKSD